MKAFLCTSILFAIIMLFAEGNTPTVVFKENGLFGIKETATEKVLVEPKFDKADQFMGSYAHVSIGKDETFIDKKGDYLFPLGKYHFASNLISEGLVPFFSDTGQCGFLDIKGNIAIPAQYYAVQNFSEGLAPVSVGHKWGYIDHNQNFVIKPSFDWAETFIFDRALVKLENKVGYINKSGIFVIKPEYCFGYGFMPSGFTRVRKSSGDSYIIDVNGKIIATAKDFHDNLVRIKFKNGKWGYLGYEGGMRIHPQFEDATDFSGGIAAVKKDDEWIYINTENKVVDKKKSQQLKELEEEHE